MPRTVLRQFTGGLSNEIDAQNLRDDQGQEAFDINLKGHALEPGESTVPIDAAGHYYYRGEWIQDSKAVSFEESGIGVVKTFDDKRPVFEEIIKDDENVSRNLGPPLPPEAAITGTIVSEGTRGERPGEGSHLLKLPENALGGVDTTESLKVHEADVTDIIGDMYYYGGQPYWIVKSGTNNVNWVIRTRKWTESAGVRTWLLTYLDSTTLIHNSGGSFFKGGYFVCWDDTYIDSVLLDPTIMTSDVQNTILYADGGDAGTEFSSSFTSGATSSGITGVDIESNGIISFSQRITTPNTVPLEYQSSSVPGKTSANSADERWLRTPSGSGGCFVVFIRDGVSHANSEANGTGDYSTGAEPTVFTTKLGDTEEKRNVFPGWTSPKGKFTFIGREDNGHGVWTESAKARMQKSLDALDDIDFGIKYAVVFVKNDSWVRVRFQAPVAKPPDMFVIPNALSIGGKTGKTAIKGITCTRTLSSLPSEPTSNVGYEMFFETKNWLNETVRNYMGIYYGHGEMYYKDTINIELIFPTLPKNYNTIHWKYTAPVNDSGSSSHGHYAFAGTESIGYDRAHHKVWSTRTFHWDFSTTQAGTNGTNDTNSSAGSWTRYLGAKKNIQYESFGSLGGPKNSKPGWLVTNGASDGTYKNNVISPTVAGKMNRLCSFSRSSGNVVQQEDFSVSGLWTTAKFESEDNSISFIEATRKNFRVGDWIKIGQNGTNKSMHLNLMGKAKGSDGSDKLVEQTFIVAKILEIPKPGKLLLSEPEYDHSPEKTKKYIDEDCYPVITGFIKYDASEKVTLDEATGGPVCKVIKSDFSANVLVGHGAGRLFQDAVQKEELTEDVLEVRGSGAEGINAASRKSVNYTHRIDWTGNEVRAVEHTADLYRPRIFYTKGGRLYSQNGSTNSPPSSVALSASGKYYVDGKYLTHIDKNDITIYKPNLKTEEFVKTRPKLPSGLGLRGNVQDARTFVNSSNAVFVCVKIGGKWKLVKTSNIAGVGAETSLLSYDFNKPIGFDGTRLWGIGSSPTDGWDFQEVIPFYESDVIGSYVFFSSTYYDVALSNAALALNPSKSAWGLVTDSRLGGTNDTGTPRYLSINWQTDSGLLNNSAITIGLNHELGKMVGEQTFKWYPINYPSSFYTGSAASNNTDPVVISDIPGNTYIPVASVEISFKSEIKRDVVFFKKSETLLPSAGDTGGENRIAFLNYTDAGQAFYVLGNNIFSLTDQLGKEPEVAFRLGQVNVANPAFDASKVGISSFLLGAPNMFNAYGPNIDIYYRASFINKWGHEGAPSPLPSKGISPLNSVDDCVQVNFAASFFKLSNEGSDIEKIRLYRYGGDSSEFLYLRDIDMPVLPFTTAVVDGVTVKTPYFPTVTWSYLSTFARKDSNSPFYLLKTNYDISILGGFVNSNFDFTCTSSANQAQTLDGSWRINQLSENESPSPAFATTLSTKLTATAVEVVLASTTAPSAWPVSGVVKIDDEYISYTSIASTTLKECTRGIYNSTAAVHEVKQSDGTTSTPVTVVEWVLEMEHRNQDTTELKVEIEGPLTGSVITVADTSVFNNTGQILIGSDIYNYTAKTAAGTGSATADTFTTVTHDSGPNGDHKANSLVRSYNEVYTTTNITNTTIVIDGFGYRDKARTPIASLHSMQIDNWPPLGMKYGLQEGYDNKRFFETESKDDYFRYIKAVGSMYFGALDANLRFSKYGTPEYWPLEAIITLDSEIRCIEEHAGEGIVFTTNSVYRCRGTDPKAMIAFRVPDAKGLPVGYEHTVSDYNGGLLWLTASDGIAMYQGGRVTYLTRDKHDIGQLKKPYSCVVDGVYWLFQEPGSGSGFRLELVSGELRLAQTSIEAYYAYFAKALGIGVVVTKDTILNSNDIISLINSTTADGDATVTVSSTADLKEGMSVTGSGIPDNTTILSITSLTVFELSADATASGTANVGLTFGSLVVEEIGGIKATNILWKSKKIDAGEPAIPKALGSIAIVYEALGSKRAETIVDGIRGQALAAELLGLDPENFDAGDIATVELETSSDLYSIFTKYDEPDQTFTIDIGGESLTSTERRIIIMPIEFLTSTVTVGDRVWNELLADNSIVESIGTEYVGNITEAVVASDGSSDLLFTDADHTLQDGDEIQFTTTTTLPGNITVDINYYVNDKTATTFKVETVVDGGNVQYSSTAGSGVLYGRTNPTIVLDKEPLRTGTGNIYWGNLPRVEVYLNEDDTPSRVYILPPGDTAETQSMDLYLNDLKRFRTVSVSIEGNVRVQALSLRHYPLQRYQSSTLHHSADVFYKGDIDFRVMLDGKLIYRRELTNAGDDFKEERIYLPASSFGQRVHYMNESRTGMIESVKFNGSVAA